MASTMVDLGFGKRTMMSAGGEDTALLRSNRSARAGAGTRAGVCQSGSPLPLRMAPTRSGHQALNLGVWGGAPRQHLGAVGHMSTLVGRQTPFSWGRTRIHMTEWPI